MTGTREQERHWEYLRLTGRPSLLDPDSAEVRRAVSKLRSFNARGMSYSTMARQIGRYGDALTRFNRDERPGMRRSLYNDISSLRFDPAEQTGHVRLLGSQRRLQALRAEGFTHEYLSVRMGYSRTSPVLHRLTSGFRAPGKRVGFLKAYTARTVEALYEELAGTDPEDAGVTGRGVTYSRNRAAEHGWAPASCWDPDTIDDPDAIPDWTGFCGTAEGLRIHARDGIRVCDACLGASPEETRRFSPLRLQKLRAEKHLTMKRLAERVGVDQATVRWWETGRSAPRNIDPLLSALDCTIDDLFE